LLAVFNELPTRVSTPPSLDAGQMTGSSFPVGPTG
jgi:hypothetical protein